MIRMKNPAENPLKDPIVIDIDGPKGNAWELMAIAADVARFYGYSKHECEDLRLKMMSGDYANLIATMEKEFPETFDIRTENDELFRRVYDAYHEMGGEDA